MSFANCSILYLKSWRENYDSKLIRVITFKKKVQYMSIEFLVWHIRNFFFPIKKSFFIKFHFYVVLKTIRVPGYLHVRLTAWRWEQLWIMISIAPFQIQFTKKTVFLVIKNLLWHCYVIPHFYSGTFQPLILPDEDYLLFHQGSSVVSPTQTVLRWSLSANQIACCQQSAVIDDTFRRHKLNKHLQGKSQSEG